MPKLHGHIYILIYNTIKGKVFEEQKETIPKRIGGDKRAEIEF